MLDQRVLRVVSIIAIIFGALGALGFLSLFLGGSYLGAAGGIIGAALSGFVLLIALFGLAVSALYVWAGVVGIQNWDNGDKAPQLMNIGIILIVVQVVSMVLDLIGGLFGLSDVIGLVIPVLYYMSAKQLAE